MNAKYEMLHLVSKAIPVVFFKTRYILIVNHLVNSTVGNLQKRSKPSIKS